MKIIKRNISVLLLLIMVFSLYAVAPTKIEAITINNDLVKSSVGDSFSRESIVYKSGSDYITVADFGNNEYVNLDNSQEIYYKVNIDSEIFMGSIVNLKINSLDSGDVSTSSISIGTQSGYYKLVQYVPIDLSDYSGKIELSIWVVLANGQKVYEDEPVKLNIYSKIASGTCGDNLTWILYDNGTLDISGTGEMYDFNRFSDEGSDDAIPWKNYRQQIKSVKINEGVTSIGSYAFFGRPIYGTDSTKNDSLLSVDLPNSLIDIRMGAFFGCFSLEYIKIPQNVTTIGNGSFIGCKMLTNIELPDGLCLIDNSTFDGCTNLKYIKFPASLNEIGRYAFYGSGLETIYIPKNVKYIGDRAFQDCNNLQNVYIEGNINLQESVFSYCSKLKTVVFNGGITAVDKLPSSNTRTDFNGRLFYECPSLEIAVLPSYFSYNPPYDNDDSVKKYPIQSWRNFDGCGNLKFANIKFNDNSKIIDGVLFSEDGKTLLWYPEDLTDSSYDIPDGVQTLAHESFQNQQYLSHINIPDSVTNLEGHVFYNCSKLNNIIIPDGITTLYDFQNCISLKAIYIPNSVNTMYHNYKGSQVTFENCTDLIIYSNKNSYAETFANKYSDCIAKEAVYCNFDANGGSVETNKKPVIPDDKYWTLPTPTRQGYTFDGWYTTKTGGTKVTEDTVVSQDSSYTLYAHWTTNTIGDVNGDGEVRVDDATYIQKYIAGISGVTYTDKQKALADVTKDGKIDVNDVTLIQKHLAGLAKI